MHIPYAENHGISPTKRTRKVVAHWVLGSKEIDMRIYHVIDHLNQNYGSYSSREKAVRMAESLRDWFSGKLYYVEEVYYELDNQG